MGYNKELERILNIIQNNQVGMNISQLGKKLEQNIKSAKCTNKGCLSGSKDNLEIVWFGNQYQQKIITCSSCYVMNDQAIKKSIPTSFNVLPVSAFISKFVSQVKMYQENKASPKWLPTDLKERQKQHLTQLQSFQFKLTGTLKTLAESLQNFTKKVIQHNSAIYNNQTFNQIISLYSGNRMDQSLSKIQSLINYLNYGQDDKYRFDDMDYRAKRSTKLSSKIEEISNKVLKVLNQLLDQLQEKNQNITKI